ncbi:heterokaryon incompatibility protein-domain-containing protein [Podospora didyma]|uniref:Heterokaryon incompatibility protein-domain-containing protein n=1 Tax=Podospora didyma TaxID=330526 RepID=A0AAE0NX77_9PEZI|nr:heterokaryon incompatibility protein-domain-containing protein [Podospora didyma]
MRLINVGSLDLEEFHGAASIPKYAILSHTWGPAEASFQDWTKALARRWKIATRQPGFAKVILACKQARLDRLHYLWVDTVCIDKSSSAELSEAINSMYAWYAQAHICYVYLSDVDSRHHDNNKVDTLDLVRKSRWFTRGWTLQELLAPSNIVFYLKDWQLLGTKNALAVLISEVTGIDEVCLHKRKRLDEYSIAQRMAWAANRQTTREEDMAYCLLGIFGINMPLLYGEGSKAFRRLQEEIIKVSDDHSIFAFDTDLSEETLFAHHPHVFASRGNRIHPNFALQITTPFSMTNAGLSITTPLIQTLSPYWVLALLNCVEVADASTMRRSQICLPLFGKDGRFMRARTPVCLISKQLDDTSVDFRDEIQDLTTREETSYIISYFSRVYSIYGTEMDVALKGFDFASQHRAEGFMLTFPRGMAGYQLYMAFPPQDNRPSISFFIPTDPPSIQLLPSSDGGSPVLVPSTETSVVRGVMIFKNDTVQPPHFVGVYLALEGLEEGGEWTCKILPIPADFTLFDVVELLGAADRNGLHEKWTHYHRLGNAIVAARTRFQTLAGEPCKEAIMVEVVFDADTIFREQDL